MTLIILWYTANIWSDSVRWLWQPMGEQGCPQVNSQITQTWFLMTWAHMDHSCQVTWFSPGHLVQMSCDLQVTCDSGPLALSAFQVPITTCCSHCCCPSFLCACCLLVLPFAFVIVPWCLISLFVNTIPSTFLDYFCPFSHMCMRIKYIVYLQYTIQKKRPMSHAQRNMEHWSLE